MTQKERARKHYVNNRDAYLQRASRQRKYEKEKLSPERLIYQRTRYSAKARGLECSIALDDIVLPTVCPYLGIELAFNEGKPGRNSYSVDRIDNTLGYIPGNIEIISYQANAMKQNATKDEQIRFAQEILNRYGVSNLQ